MAADVPCRAGAGLANPPLQADNPREDCDDHAIPHEKAEIGILVRVQEEHAWSRCSFCPLARGWPPCRGCRQRCDALARHDGVHCLDPLLVALDGVPRDPWLLWVVRLHESMMGYEASGGQVNI